MRSPWARRRLGIGVQVRAELGKALQLAILGVDQLQRTGNLLHRLDLSVAADTGNRNAGVDGRTDTGVEQLSLQEDLAVGDGDNVGRDIGRNITCLGLDDGQRGQRTAAFLVGSSLAARSSRRLCR